MNSQNNLKWFAENPRLIHELPVHDEDTGVWCVIKACRITGPIFYDNTVNAVRHVNNIPDQLFFLPNRRRKAT
jgi:hypothetical protein